MPVEVAPAAAATTTMEITVGKFELLRELTATQGVVERKTTIPILSNYLFEAAGDKLMLTATDLDLSLRTSCNAKVKKEGACTIPARKLYDYVKLLPDADITIRLLGEPLGQHSLRTVQHEDGWHGALEFSRLACFPVRRIHQDFCARSAFDDRQDWLCHCQRRVSLHSQWRSDGAEA